MVNNCKRVNSNLKRKKEDDLITNYRETNRERIIVMKIVEENVVIVGGGIAGLATAVALKKTGIRALVLERSDGLRTGGAAITLMPNAWVALDALGVADKLRRVYPRLTKGKVTNITTGAVQSITLSGVGGDGPRTVVRRALLEALAEELPPETIRFSSKVTSMETQRQEGSSTAIIHLEDGTSIKAKVLIGCDGVNSVVARWLKLAAPVESGRWGVLGLAEFPEGHGLDQEVHQFADATRRVGFVRLTDEKVYWFFTWQISTKEAEKVLRRDPDLIQRAILEKYGKDLPESYLNVVRHADLRTVSLSPLKFRYPWSIVYGNLHKDNIVVAGDAMHPMTPDLGQGGGSSLEDAVVIGRHIGESFIRNGGIVLEDISRALDEYVKERKWRAAALVAGAYFSGWAQQSGSGWFKILIIFVFYKFAFSRIFKLAQYDCGKLPTVPSDSDQVKQD